MTCNSTDERIAALVETGMQDISPFAPPSALQRAAFVVRHGMTDDLLAPYQDLPAAWRRKVRLALPPLIVAEDGLLGWVCPNVRRAAWLLLALLAANAVWNGLGLVQSGGFFTIIFMAVLSSMILGLGEALSSRGAYLPQPTSAEAIPSEKPAAEQSGWLSSMKRSSWQTKGVIAWLVWKNLRRIVFFLLFLRGNARLALTIAWCSLLGIALLRDFLLGRPVLETFLSGVSALLMQGDAWPLFSSFYGFWCWLAGVLLLLAWPFRLNRRQAVARLHEAAIQWREDAVYLVELLAAGAVPARKNEDRLAAVGQKLHSFARELDPTRSQWLLERLRDLGLEFAEEEKGVMRWREDLREHYDVLGLIREGDPCFVDKAPEYVNGSMMRKGLVRKVRS